MKGRHHPSDQPGQGDEHRAARSWLRQAAGIRSGRILLATAAVGLCAIVTGVTLAALSASAGRSGPTGSGVGANSIPSAATVQTARPQAPAAPVATTGEGLTSAGIAKTALQLPSGSNHQMLAWKKGRGGTAWSAVTAQLSNAMQASGVRLYPELRQACVALRSSVETAQAAPPIPDAAMQRLYAKVLTGLSGAAARCSSAISIRPDGDEGLTIKVNKALLNRSLSEFTAESKELYTATAAIRTLSR